MGELLVTILAGIIIVDVAWCWMVRKVRRDAGIKDGE